MLPLLQSGDLLFVHEPLSGGLGAAIEATGRATVAWLREHGAPATTDETASHVGLAWRRPGDGSLFVVEALEPAVRLTPADAFFAQPGAVYYVGSLDDDRMRAAQKTAAEVAVAQVGKPYADEFQPPPAAFYCSSLVEYAFEHALGGVPHPFNAESFALIFEPRQFWQDYYQKMNRTLPVDATGSNPTLLLHSPAVRFEVRRTAASHEAAASSHTEKTIDWY
jgi:hypothetical protein